MATYYPTINEFNGNSQIQIVIEQILLKAFIRRTRRMNEVEKYIRSIPDFPEPGIIFRILQQ